MEALNSPYYIYIIYGVASFIFCLILNRLLLKFAKSIGPKEKKNNNGLIRWATQNKPALGGISFFLIFLISFVFYFILPFVEEAMSGYEMLALMSSVTLAFTIGLFDDAYNSIPFSKFAGQLLCAIIMIVFGVYINATPFALLNWLITIIWVVGIMNSINMLDNMDGVTASVSLLILVTTMMILKYGPESSDFYFFICFGVAVGLFAFLFVNWKPSKMYMGDSGSQFLGALLAFISIKWMWNYHETSEGLISIRQFIIPMLAFTMPLIDTITVTVRRIARGQSPFLGGRDHTTHHLAYFGIGEGWVAFIFAALTFVSGLLIIYILNSMDNWNLSMSMLMIAYFFIILFGMQWFYEKAKKNKPS